MITLITKVTIVTKINNVLAITRIAATEKETEKLSTTIKHSLDITVPWHNYPRYIKRRLT